MEDHSYKMDKPWKCPLDGCEDREWHRHSNTWLIQELSEARKRIEELSSSIHSCEGDGGCRAYETLVDQIKPAQEGRFEYPKPEIREPGS